MAKYTVHKLRHDFVQIDSEVQRGYITWINKRKI